MLTRFQTTILTLIGLALFTPLQAHQPKIVSSDAVESLPFPGQQTQILANYDDMEANVSVLEVTIPPKTFGAPPHVHSREDEWFYVLEGEINFLERESVIVARQGTLAVLPRGKLHAFWNDTDQPARMLLIIAPGEFSDFFDEVVQNVRAAPGEDPKRVGEIISKAAAKRGVEIFFDKVPESAMHLLPK